MFDSVCDIEHFSKKSTKWKKCHTSQCFGCWSKHRSAVYWELRRGNFHYFVFVQKQARKCLILYAIYIKIYRFRGFSQKIDKVEKVSYVPMIWLLVEAQVGCILGASPWKFPLFFLIRILIFSGSLSQNEVSRGNPRESGFGSDGIRFYRQIHLVSLACCAGGSKTSFQQFLKKMTNN